MKKLFLFLVSCTLASTSLAQSEYRQAADVALANVDKSGVRSGVLYDRVFPGADLQNFNATTPSSAEHYLQARSELYEATLYDVANQLTVDELKNLIWQNEKRGVVSVGVTLAELEVINYDALELDNNQRYRLKPGQSNANVYQVRKATVAALLSPTVGRGTNYFELPAWSVLSTGETEVSSIVVDFGDGNPTRTLTVGSGAVPATYQNLGQKTIRYTINLSDGSQQTALSTLTVNETARVTDNIITYVGTNAPVPTRDDIGLIEPLSIEGYEPFQGYTERSASKGKGEAFIYYARGRTSVRKPVIILDGFDPDDKRNAQEIYAERLQYKRGPGDFPKLGDELRESGADNESDVIILNFPKYEYDCGLRTICTKPSPRGTCNQQTVRICRVRDGGADYIERNGLVLVELLRQINERLRASGSTEKITLIGPSMGGLISRYALRYMEEPSRNLNHNVKLWVSFDSPHNGANIPIGMQLLLDHLANTLGFSSAKDGYNRLDSPAARQMLLDHMSAHKDGNELAAGSPGFRDQFVTTMNAIGFPQASCLRKVALSNGSKNGTLQGFPPCQSAFRLRARVSDKGTVGCLAVGIGVGCIFGPIGCYVGAAVCGLARDRILEANTYTTPSTGSRCLVMRQYWTSFGAGTVEAYARGSQLTRASLDLLPGGYYDVLGLVAEQSAGNLPAGGKFAGLAVIEANASFRQSSFIPTVSSYALRNTDRNWSDPLNNINVQNDTPFDEIYAPDNNEDHTFLSAAGVNFVRAQIAKANQQQCGQPQPPVTNPVLLTSGSCYVIKSQKTSQSLQAMGDGSVKQQGGNGQTNQIWKAEDAGNSRFRFTTQNGSGQVIKANDSNRYGEQLSLGGYADDERQKWAIEQNGSSGNYRIYRSGALTWDLSNYGNSPELQLWGTTSEPFYDYRSFRFESATCPGGGTLPPNCDFNLSANTVNAGCNQQVQLTASCNGANCDGVSYSWTGNGLNQNGQSVSFNAPGSNGGFTYTVTASRSGCSAKTATGTVNVSGCGGGTGGGSLTPGCYVIKSQKTGQSLQAMDDGSIKQQGSNGQANQVWKAEDVGSSQYRFTTQNGSNQVIKANDGNNYGEHLSLGGYTGDERQRWAVQQDGGSGNYRVYRSNGITWDLNNFGNNPELQLWGSTSDPFYDYRSFRFESAGCSGTPPPPPPPGGGSLAFQIVSYDCNSGLLQYRFNSSDGSAVSVNLPGIFGGTVSPNTVLSYTFPGDGLQGRTVTGTATQSGTQISINFTNGCGLSGGRQASLDAGSPAVGDGLATTLLVSPNPAHGAATARFRLALGETATLSVVNLLGKVLHRKAVVGTGDEQTERIELEHQAAGIYLVRLSTGKASYIARVVLER